MLQARLKPEVQQHLNLFDDWATNPTYIVTKILLSPGCSDFPPDQWLNIVKGYVVDLARVIEAHYSSDVNTNSQCIQVPKQSKAIKTHGDWVIVCFLIVHSSHFSIVCHI